MAILRLENFLRNKLKLIIKKTGQLTRFFYGAPVNKEQSKSVLQTERSEFVNTLLK